VSLVADRASPVRLTFGQGQVVVEAQTEGRARAAEAVTASFEGDEPPSPSTRTTCSTG
jgi:DNA polymerase-3 subunit beta